MSKRDPHGWSDHYPLAVHIPGRSGQARMREVIDKDQAVDREEIVETVHVRREFQGRLTVCSSSPWMTIEECKTWEPGLATADHQRRTVPLSLLTDVGVMLDLFIGMDSTVDGVRELVEKLSARVMMETLKLGASVQACPSCGGPNTSLCRNCVL